MADLQYTDIVKLLKYEPETGKLYWLERPVEMFKGGGKTTADHVCKSWNSKFAGKEAFTADLHGYFSGRIHKRLYRAHRIVWLLHHGVWPSEQIDHIDGDRRNNHITNLRDVSASANRKNQKLRKTNTSGYHGVSWCNLRNRWVARINRKLLGRFVDKDMAISVRKEAEISLGFHENHGRLK